MMEKRNWIARLKELHKAKNSHHFAIGDCVNEGIAEWGSDACWAELQKLAGSKNTRNFYRRCATVATLYPQPLRFANLTFSIYEALRHFPLSFLSTFIPSVADSGRSCKQILFHAIEQFGSNRRRRRRSYRAAT